MNVRNNICMAAAAVVIGTAAAGAQMPEGMGFALNTLDNYEPWGTGKKEACHIAVRLTDPMMVGKKVVGAVLPINYELKDVSYDIWLSKELKVTTVDGQKTFVPDITSKSGTPDLNSPTYYNTVIVRFEEPYTVPEEGVYLGVSYGQGSTNYPAMISREKVTDGFYVFAPLSYIKWKERSNDFNVVLPIMAIVEGEDFPKNALELTSIENINVRSNVDFSFIPAKIRNVGSNRPARFDYTYDIDGITGSGSYNVATLRNQYGLSRDIELQLPYNLPPGKHKCVYTIESVNDSRNEAEKMSAEAELTVLEFNPQRTAVLEEYTGTWCQYCPRGWLGLEMMYDRYPDRFIGISYHSGDVMAMKNGIPQVSNHFPDAWIDRTRNTDAYCGDLAGNEFGVDLVWEEACARLSEASICIDTEWIDDTHLRVDSHTTFAADYKDVYRVEYVLLADDLHSPDDEWSQLNGFSGNDQWLSAPGMSQFVNAGTMLKDFHYNSVAILTSGLTGVYGSLPDIVANKVIEHSYTFDIKEAVNTKGQWLVQDKNKLRVVAMVLHTGAGPYGEVVNATVCKAGGSDSVEQLVETEEISTVYYDLFGNKATADTKGVVIKTTRYSDGTSKSVKVLNR